MKKKEIIEELIFRNLPDTTENRRDFNKLMNDELARIPNKFGDYAENFFVGKFLGAIYSFQYTSLKNSLGVHTTLWKYNKIRNCLHLVFLTEKNNIKKAYLRTIHIAINPPSDASPNKDAFLKDIPFTQQTEGAITYLNTQGFRWDEQRVTREHTNAIDIDSINNELKIAGFIAVHGGISEKGIDNISEETVKDFSSKDIKEVNKAFEKYLKTNRELLLNSFEVFKQELSPDFFKEAFFNGFCFGGIVFNFKRRYWISIIVQRNTGMGRIDLGMISLGENKENLNPFIMFAEFKIGMHSALEATAQIKERYQNTWLNLKSFEAQAVIAGINYHLITENNRMQLRSDDIKLEIISLRPFSIEKLLAALTQTQGKEKILENLEHLSNSRYGIETFQNFFPLLVGHTLSYKGEKFEVLQKRLFIEDAEFARYRGILVLDFQEEDQNSDQKLIFNFQIDGEERNLRSANLRNRADSVKNAVDYLYSEALNKGQTIHQIDITVAAKKETGKPFFQSIDYKSLSSQGGPPIDLNQFSDIRKKFKSLNTIKFSDLFEENNGYQIKADSLKFPLFELSTLLQNENDFQAFIQGVFSEVKRENTEVRVFGEANYAASGQADFQIIVADVKREKGKSIEVKNAAVFVLELKHIETSNPDRVREKAQEAYKQAEERYKKNLDTTTPVRRIKFLGFVFTPNSLSAQDCFSYIAKKRTIDQPSDDSKSPKRESPIKRRKKLDYRTSFSGVLPNCNSPSSSKRQRRNIDSCLEYSLEEAEEEKKVIEDLLQERKRGEVILIADDYALLILANLRKEESYPNKLIVISESPERLEIMHSIMGLIRESQDIDDWLRLVKRDFPKESDLLESNKDLIHFSELKAVLASEQKPLFKVISDYAHVKDFSSLGVDADNVAAIYLGNYPSSSENWHSLLASDSVNPPILYRKSLLKPKMIEKLQGSLNYFIDLQKILELEKSEINNYLLEESLIGLGLAESFFLSANQALEEAGLGHEKSWMPLLDSMGKLEGRPSGLVFLNLQTYETRTLDVDIKPISEFQTHLRDLYEKVNPHFVFDHEEKIPRWSTSIEQAESVDGLNSAFLLQTLLAWSKQKDRTDLNDLSQTAGNTRLSQWIEIHSYIGLAQMGHGAVSDITKVVSLVKTLVTEEQVVVKSTLSAFRSGLNAFFNEGLGILFNTANVVMDSGELSEANTEAERAIFITQLAFDVGGLSLSLGVGGASLLGATMTASVLGALAVPVVGLNIGITGLVKAFEEVVANAQAVGNYFYQLDNAYRQLGYQKQMTSENNSYLSPLYGAVIKEINFQTNTIHYGDSYLYSSQTKTGSGKSNYIFWAGYFPHVIMNKRKAFSIRDRLGYPKVKMMSRRNISLTDLFLMYEGLQPEIFNSITTWILPSTPESYLSYSWKNLPFATVRHDTGFSVLRQLEEEDFHYDFYIFPSEYIVSAITPEFIKTNIKIVLDSQKRTFVIPQFSWQERFILQYLHYTLESPKTAGKTILYLGEVGSLKLESHHANYNWELVCNNCTNQERIQFTATGIKIYGINVEVSNSSLGNYYLNLDNNLSFKLDVVKKQVIPLEMDAAGDRNNTHIMNDYLEKNSHPNSQNFLIKIDNYPMQNNQGETYNGTAFYSTAEDGYFYTDGLPIDEMRANLDSSIPFHVNFIGCIEEVCYFWAPTRYLWSSNRDTHEIVRRYHITKQEEIKSASILADHTVQIKTTVEICDYTYFPRVVDCFERYVNYDIKPDGELYLSSLSDSKDNLLQLFENEKGEVVASKNTSYFTPWQIVTRFYSVAEDYKHHFDLDQSDFWKGQKQFAANRFNQLLSILPSSEDSSYIPLWIRVQNQTHYQLITSGIQEKKLLCLDSLHMKNGTEVLYFYKPSDVPVTHGKAMHPSANEVWSSINPEVRPQSESTGKLFLKSNAETPAKALDFSLLSAFRSQERIFIVTTEYLIKELDAFGKSYLTAVTADWIKAHPKNWWAEISTLVSNRLTEITGPISIYGLQDQSGQALGVWYDDKRQSFIFTQPPLNEQGKQLPIRYLTSQGIFDFFFCVENGILYQAKSYTDSVNESFNNGTQLKVKLPDLVPFVASLKTIRLQNKRWVLETQEGEIFSSRFLPTNHWYLEKISLKCYHELSPFNWSQVFNNDCLNGFNQQHLFSIASDRVNTTLASSCSIDNFKRVAFSERGTIPCLAVDPNKPIPVGYKYWWLPRIDKFFSNIFYNDFNDENSHPWDSWNYLGLCKRRTEHLSACFFSQEEKVIYFVPEGIGNDFRKYWEALPHSEEKMKIRAELAQKQGENHILLVLKADGSLGPNYYGIRHFIPLFEGVQTIGLFLVEDTTPNFSFTIDKKMLMHYRKILFYQSHYSQDITLYFPQLPEDYSIYIGKKGTDIVLRYRYLTGNNAGWIFLDAMENNTFNKLLLSFYDHGITVRKVLERNNTESLVIADAEDPYHTENTIARYETLETIQQLFLQHHQEDCVLRYDILVQNPMYDDFRVYDSQSERLMLEQPEVKVQQNPAVINKVFRQPNYLWWALGAGTITLFSAAALVASVRYWLIRRRHSPNRENAIPLVTMVVAATMVSTPFLPEAQAYEIPTVKKLATHSGFSEEHDCIKSETLIGLLGICVNGKRVIYWQQTKKHAIFSLENYFIHRTENNTHYLEHENKEAWEWKLDLDIEKIKSIPPDVMQRRIPTHLYEKLAEQKKRQEVLTVFRQQIVITSGHYLGNGLTLHTPIGDLFKAIGLAPDWLARDDIHFLNRGWITTQQLLSQQIFSEKLLSLSVGLSEIALLHPRIQSTYAYLTNNSDFSKAKTVIRFIGDLFQLGFYNFSYLARLLEFYFPNNESVWKIGLGLRMASQFYLLTDDLSYWYLGMALFVLPYLPTLLENFGVPITRGLHGVCNKLTQVFIVQSLLNYLSKDTGRIAQRDWELMLADNRVEKGRERLRNFTRSRFSFFEKNKNGYPFSANDEIEREQSTQLINPSLW